MKTCISVSIDLTDEFEADLLKWVQSKGNKSRYIKRLIYADKMGKREVVIVNEVVEEEDNSAMNGFF